MITDAINNGLATIVVFMDFAKAFDKVSHRALIVKLEGYGFAGNLLSWLKDFLSGRKQRVVMGEVVSDWMDVLSGVPQGSVLGPLLFIIFINDLPEAVKGLCKLFADDTKLISTIRSPSDLTILQSDVDNLVEWADNWLMEFNDDKCKYMVFNNKQLVIDLKMKGEPLSSTEKERDLGIYISSDLKWGYQVSLAANRASSVLGQLKKCFKKWSVSIFRQLYVALVRPHLEYAIVAWCPHLKKDIEVLEKVQRRATKLVKSIKHLSYEERLKRLRLTKLSARRVRADMIEFYKITNGLTEVCWRNPIKQCNYLSVEGPATSIRGAKHRLAKQFTKNSQRENFMLNRVVDNWNKLPKMVVEAKSKNFFKKKLDEFNTALEISN